MGFHEFRKRLSIQMCEYRTFHLNYPGDERMRGTTRLRRNRRGVKKRARADDEYGVAYEQFVAATNPRTRGTAKRFHQGDLLGIREHFHSVESFNSSRKCVWCGKQTYHKCGLCDKWLCVRRKPHKEGHMLGCMLDYHNEYLYGLGLCDCDAMGVKKEEWKMPTSDDEKKNAEHIKKMKVRQLKWRLVGLREVRRGAGKRKGDGDGGGNGGLTWSDLV